MNKISLVLVGGAADEVSSDLRSMAASVDIDSQSRHRSRLGVGVELALWAAVHLLSDSK